MAHQITGIDHARIAVADAGAARQAFVRLGFSVAPATRDDAAGFIRFGTDYVELAAPGDAGGDSERLRRALAGAAGRLAGLGLVSRDLAASRQSLVRAGVEPLPPVGEGLISSIALPDGLPPGLSTELRSVGGEADGGFSEWREHPNTALGIVSLTVLLDNPEAAISDYSRLFGPAACTPTDEMVTVHTGRGLIFLVSPNGFDDLHPGLDLRLPAAPAMVALTIRVADLSRAADVLSANGVPVARRGGHLGIPSRDALGIGLELAEA
ncbi:VOC family protein [Telmatospirillum siberiense]|nr:VOC family protein [Telmatospirillum siberiense]